MLSGGTRSWPSLQERWPSVARAIVFGIYIGFLILALVYPTPFWGFDFFQHFSPPENYAYPGWVAAVLSPLRTLGPYLSFVVYLLFSAVLLAIVAYREGMLWILVWPVTLYGLWAGNLTTLVFVGVLVGYRLWRQGRIRLALAPMAAVLLKPHLALGFLSWLGGEIWSRRLFRVGALALIGIIVYGLISVGSGLPGSSYWEDWFLVQGFSPLSLLPPLPKIFLWAVGLLLLSMWLWRNRESRWAFPMAWAAGVLITPYFQIQDLLFFAPALTLLAERNKIWWLAVIILGIAGWVNVFLIPGVATIVVLGLLYGASREGAIRDRPKRDGVSGVRW